MKLHKMFLIFKVFFHTTRHFFFFSEVSPKKIATGFLLLVCIFFPAVTGQSAVRCLTWFTKLASSEGPVQISALALSNMLFY